MSSPANFTQHIADIPTVNEHSIAISAMHHDGQKLVLVGSEAIDIEQISAFVAAVNEAVEVLSLA